MSRHEQDVQIEEEDAVKSLKAVLNKITSQNERCVVLVDHRFENTGTPEAKVVLVYEKGKCEKSE